MLIVTGWWSAITQALLPLLPAGEQAERAREDYSWLNADRYLFAAGVLRPKKASEQTLAEISESFFVNCARVIQMCELILAGNDQARICVVGSESGFSWSHDDVYAAAKAGLHRYVETRKLKPGQQLVAIAPGIISDAGMTTRRSDLDNLERRREKHPKKRFLTALEVARLVHHVLYVDEGYLSGIVIRMNGGEHTCRA